MFEEKDILALLPAELRKGENFVKLSRALSKFYKWYENEIRLNANYCIIEELRNDRLDMYGARFGAIRVHNWADDDLRKRIKLLWYRYQADLNILDNLSLNFTASSGYFSKIVFSATGISGEIDCSMLVPQGSADTPYSDLQKFWVAGCKIYPSIVDSADFMLNDSFGDISDRYATGIDPLTPTFRTFEYK